jgi:AcrR family transcriptional regulator
MPWDSFILARSIETFAEHGFQDADVQVIAEKAGVGYGNFSRSLSK